MSDTFDQSAEVRDGAHSASDSPVFTGDLNNTSFGSHPISYSESSAPIYVSSGDFSPDHSDLSIFSPFQNEKLFDSGFASSDGPNHVECYALGEWKRQNAIRIEGKERNEKELLSQIITEADDYKVEFYSKRRSVCEINKSANMEKEKLFLVNQEKFHGEANNNYWKTIAELIPNEMPADIEKKKARKNEDEKKPSIVMVQGPKPGKPTDLARMRQILLKLKHNTPPHLISNSTSSTKDTHVETVVVA